MSGDPNGSTPSSRLLRGALGGLGRTLLHHALGWRLFGGLHGALFFSHGWLLVSGEAVILGMIGNFLLLNRVPLGYALHHQRER